MSDQKVVLFYGHGRGRYACFSQFHRVPFKCALPDYVCKGSIPADNTKEMEWSCNEQYMHACKAALFDDVDAFQKILATSDPYKHKAIGRSVKGFKEAVWKQVCDDIVYRANLAKFSQNELIKRTLLRTDDALLAEAAPNDNIWGIGMSQAHPDAFNPEKWTGLNKLGQTLMRVRQELAALK